MKTEILKLIEEARLAKAITNDQARIASVGLGLEGDEGMLACRLIAQGADPASLDYLDTGSVSEKIQEAHTGGPGVFQLDDPGRSDYLALCALSADEAQVSTVRSRFWDFHKACTRLGSHDDLFRDAAMWELARREELAIMVLPFTEACLGGVTMRVYKSDRGFAAAAWDRDDPQQVAAVLGHESDGKPYFSVGAPPYCPTLEEQGVKVNKPLYPRFGVVEGDDAARVAQAIWAAETCGSTVAAERVL